MKRSFRHRKPCHPTSIIPQPCTAPWYSLPPIAIYLRPSPLSNTSSLALLHRAAAIVTQYLASIDASKRVLVGIESIHHSTRYTSAHRPIKNKQRLHRQGTEGTIGQCRSVTFSKQTLLSMRRFPHFPSRQTGEMTGTKFDNAGKDQYGPQVSLPCLKCNP